jgi:hypothetical protein
MGDYLLEASEEWRRMAEERRFDYERLHKDDMTEEERRHNLDADEDGSLWSGEYPDAKYKNQD